MHTRTQMHTHTHTSFIGLREVTPVDPGLEAETTASWFVHMYQDAHTPTHTYSCALALLNTNVQTQLSWCTHPALDTCACIHHAHKHTHAQTLVTLVRGLALTTPHPQHTHTRTSHTRTHIHNPDS